MRVVLTWIQVQNEFQIEVGSLINPTQNTHMKYEATGHSESKKKKQKWSAQWSPTQTTMMYEQDVDPRDNWHVKVKRFAVACTFRLG